MSLLIALDWGTSSLRAYLLEDGKVLDKRQSPFGIQHLPAPGGVKGYEAAFESICGDWRKQYPDVAVVTGGMVGSAQGWSEAPYVRCPADLGDLAKNSGAAILPDGGTLHIVPGVLLDEPDLAPDVIRGEEIQIAGALVDHPDWWDASRILLPGTHSKWVTMKGGKLESFSTYMTGEVFAVLREHSILGRLMPEEKATAEDADKAFDLGLNVARNGEPGDLTHQIFATRTMGLTERLPKAALVNYLSGLLIGNELTSATRELRDDASIPLIMIGEGALCDLYKRALASFGLECTAQFDNTAYIGLWDFAVARNLI
nr:2-dehydro-3-deoxygalactonokinase [uncultured Cohaesibacter sp.]